MNFNQQQEHCNSPNDGNNNQAYHGGYSSTSSPNNNSTSTNQQDQQQQQQHSPTTNCSYSTSSTNQQQHHQHSVNPHQHYNNNHDTIVSHDSCLSQHENNAKIQQHNNNSGQEEEKQVLNSNNELFFFVMTPEEMKQFMERVNGFVRERKPHQALSLLANKAKNFQTHLEDLMGQQDQLLQKTRESKLKFQFFDDIKNFQQTFYHDQERLRQINDTIYAVRSQLISVLLKKVEMLLPMQLEQEAERDLKTIFQNDPQNDTANRYVAQLEKQIQDKMYREEQERLAKLQQQEEEPTLDQDVTERKRTNTVYDFSEDCEELECPLCYRVFYEPVTLSCGHTFDRSCICRVHDYSDKCPLCRQTIHVVPYDYPITVVINELCQKYCKAQYEERKKEMEEEVGTRQLNVNHIPIFVLDFVLYPHTVLPLHIFEPRYRLMMRRCMSGSKCFGLVCCGPNRNGDIAKYGCIAKITSFKMLPDGRSIIETVGTERFKILEKWDTDGYICAKVQILKDKTENEISVIENSQRNRDTISAVVSSSSNNSTTNNGNNGQQQQSETLNSGASSNIPLTSFASLAELQTNVWRQAERLSLQQLHDQLYMMVETFMMEVGDETKQAILQKIGPFPKENEPEKLSFWVSAMLPLTTQLKLDLLSITNTKERLRVLLSICRQIAQSQQTGCSVQ
ncbi:predicted protein [Naegleria gruberi]|uniref:Predicted protein n=1 Tax=Naegleria gruberi TaxID=5762 RepID=D2VNH8_NAEGR|nr:uncharacterized protein NAEGRDRAFT_51002 [Naegleria gruberi]EFC41735.1 predicted protein [Naegleria gruberi]|eukprot:XP_002674479.1 predicted protein [Naegleria gruberi strain NEG-M]